MADMEEKVQYQSDERLRDVNEVLENCQTRVCSIFFLLLLSGTNIKLNVAKRCMFARIDRYPMLFEGIWGECVLGCLSLFTFRI